MIDTHAHMSSRVGGEINQIEIDAVILAGSSLADSVENIEFASKMPKIWAGVGIHPQCTDPENQDSIEKQLRDLEELVKNNKVVAIGECGLDYSPPPPEERERSKDEQMKLFLGQIEIARKSQLPLIIHSRKSMDEVLEVLGGYDDLCGVIHCYTGGKKRIKKVIDLGTRWYFGIDGNITYESGLEEVVREIPRDRLLAETDSPFLAPVPFRGQKCNPNYIRYIHQKVAEIWNMDLISTSKMLDDNARNLFEKVR